MKRSTSCSYRKVPEIYDYIRMVKQRKVRTNKDIKALIAHVEQCFKTEKLLIETDRLEKYMKLQALFPYKLMEWEKFAFALHNTVRKADGELRWPDLFLYMGRGNGKNGYVSFESFCLMTPINGIVNYHIDMCATAEEQAKTSFNDIWNMMDADASTFIEKWQWNKKIITNRTTKSEMRYRTNTPSSKQGLRSGMVYLDEMEEFENWENIKVFKTGLGKQKFDLDGNERSDPRSLYTSTNGDKRGGPLDKMLNDAEQILYNGVADDGLLPMLFRLNDKKQVHDPKNWIMANPSIDNFKTLKREIEKEYKDYVKDPVTNSSFMSLRMNLPVSKQETPVASWENILATNQEIPSLAELKKMNCILGVDYAKTSDMVGAVFLFHDQKKQKYYTIQHGWLCRQSSDWDRLKIPVAEFEDAGYLTIVDDVEIDPTLITDWAMSFGFNIQMLGVDTYRWTLLKKAFTEAGFDATDKEKVKLTRPSDIMLISPIINSILVNHQLCCGDDPLMRWCINNTKLIDAKNNNFTYGKIEPKSRKTDLFFALVHAMTCADRLPSNDSKEIIPEVWTF